MSPEQSLAHRAAALTAAIATIVDQLEPGAKLDITHRRHREALLDLAGFIAVEPDVELDAATTLSGEQL